MARKGAKSRVFRGEFALHLLDLVRSIRHDKETLAIGVTWGKDDEGKIYYDKGELVHAEYGLISGREAFEIIVRASDGSYELEPEVTADVVSIEQDTVSLIRAYKLREQGLPVEAKPDERPAPDGIPSYQLTLLEPAPVTAEDWVPPPPPERGFLEQTWVKDWGEHTPGFLGAKILRLDGTVVIEVNPQAVQIDTGVLDGLLRSAARLVGEEEAEDIVGLRIQVSQKMALVSPLAEGYFLVVLFDPDEVEPEVAVNRLASLVAALNESLKKS